MCTCRAPLFREMLAKKGPDLVPGVHALLGPVQRPVPIKEAVAGAVVTMELAVLAKPLQFGLVLVHLLRAWRAIVVAEDAKDRAAQILCHVDRRDRRLGI